MTFRGGYERDIREFVESTPELKAAIEAEDDDAVETIVNERFYHRPEDVLLAGQARHVLRRAGQHTGIRV